MPRDNCPTEWSLPNSLLNSRLISRALSKIPMNILTALGTVSTPFILFSLLDQG